MPQMRLTLMKPDETDVELFDYDTDVWTVLDAGSTVDRYTGDADRTSVMRFTPSAADDGVYKDFTVVANETIHVTYFVLGAATRTMGIIFDDVTNGVEISNAVGSTTDANWNFFTFEVTAPAGCTTIRVSLIHRSGTAAAYLIDNFAFNESSILPGNQPRSYVPDPEKVGGIKMALVGDRIEHVIARHRRFPLVFNVMTEVEHDRLLAQFNSSDTLYFDDGNVPQLIETGTIYTNATYNFVGITNPSGTHKAWTDSGSALPSAEGDYETSEWSTANYEAADVDDTNHVETTDPATDAYLYHKYRMISAVTGTDVRRLRIKIVALSDDSGPLDHDGVVVYAWNGSAWAELTRTTNDAKNDIEWTTVKASVAQDFVDGSGQVQILVRSRGVKDSAQSLSLRTYFVEVEVNDGLALTITPTHRVYFDQDTNNLVVKNKTQGTTLSSGDPGYTFNEETSVITINSQSTNDVIEITYDRMFEVRIIYMPERRLFDDTSGNPMHQPYIVLETITGE